MDTNMDKFLNMLNRYVPITPELMNYYLGVLVKIVIIVVLSKLVISVANRFIAKVYKLSPKFKMDERKANTLSGITKSIIKYTVYAVMGASILSVLNILTKPVLAAAGLGGIAIGFGAQSLVKDVFTGFFILFEDQYSVGDYITISGMTGTVDELGLRITKIKAFNGDLHIIPNGEIKTVTNHSRNNSLAIIDIGITYEEDEEKALGLIKKVAEKYYCENEDKVTDKPETLGIVKFDETGIVIRTVMKTVPLTHWQVERDVRRKIIQVFKENNIELPYPKRVYINRENKQN